MNNPNPDEDRILPFIDLYRSLLQMDQAVPEGTDLPFTSQLEKAKHEELVAELSQVREVIESQSWITEHLKILLELGRIFTSEFDLEKIYTKAFELVSRVMPSEAFFIAIYQKKCEKIQFPFMIDDGIRYPIDELEYGVGNVSQVIESRRTIHIQTKSELLASTDEFRGNPEEDTGTAIFVPMLFDDQVIGVISAQCYREFAYRNEHEELLQIIGMQVANAIENARLYDQIRRQSLHDDLTKLKNYRAFHQDLAEMLRCERTERVTLLMIDSDNLKQANDAYGHHIGDALIQRIATALQACTSNNQQSYRYAGDEFMVLVPDRTVAEVEQIVEEIRAYLRSNPILHDDHVVDISVSVGISVYPEHAQTGDQLKQTADHAMYLSKSRGKNRTTVFET
ncbi:sensor domain-containing diguanylate cyclase [Tumebacillus permanentifrigoris]|uniref:Diguanylate cyclase (GGDEF)-like protein n=1 Tax=Tumebacillus permanentifrigoris TaxID=378543 RepID=A0A316D5F6_9BACL|nr:sensor domain-containing diguanylate cyclase [Tumebacillus permanentifrigoris]PWK06661.1 diguanylate cyclase (GGDEF)-like protein [Tumebacillus permanentifrigoris]